MPKSTTVSQSPRPIARSCLDSRTPFVRLVVSSYLASCQLRGMAPEASKFVADLWSHHDTIKACSEAAGVELVPIMEYEVRSLNALRSSPVSANLKRGIVFLRLISSATPISKHLPGEQQETPSIILALILSRRSLLLSEAQNRIHLILNQK